MDTVMANQREILVVSVGTSCRESRVRDLYAVEKALQEAYSDWVVRRAFTSKIIIHRIQTHDGEMIDPVEMIDHVEQALERAVSDGVRDLVVQPTFLMRGVEYDEMRKVLEGYEGKFDSVGIAAPLLGDLRDENVTCASSMLLNEESFSGDESDASRNEDDSAGGHIRMDDASNGDMSDEDVKIEASNDDMTVVADAVVAAAVEAAGYESAAAAARDGIAMVFIGHGTSHTAKVAYSRLQAQMTELGYENAFIGTLEGEPESTGAEAVIRAVSEAGYRRVILRPLMVAVGKHAYRDVAGEHTDRGMTGGRAYRDVAGEQSYRDVAGENDDSWRNRFEASGLFERVEVQLEGMGRIPAVMDLYLAHTTAAITCQKRKMEKIEVIQRENGGGLPAKQDQQI